MHDDPEKIADVALHQRADQMVKLQAVADHIRQLQRENQKMAEAIVAIRELVEGEVDVDRNGNANLAMKVYTIVAAVLKEDR